ncbi:hypothetical protein Asulf_00397 [Archaeoglobus sulfaticallidus PM70-1]|uniref:DUF22 domain-containing protein n=1 Tax=Archaeoglobus sulfaticallidus PM70-1 TaxID=387631 RepID=N0BA08_9EURY|nr:DUF22 domain-containing protein [Archaeoglobus sulfaticallidus]AGK60424.1 hypothetical protein Asulf_00397 [Archaeoglobus sulfaticallidus PM70-1]
MASVEIVYWDDRINGSLKSDKINVEPYGFQLSPIAEWRILISAEDKEVEESKVCAIDVEPIDVPENAIVSPLPIMRHALGVLLDVYVPGKLKKVEESKKITQAIFLPVMSGKIRKGELIGVINIRYVKTSTLNKISKMLSEWAEKAKWAEDIGGIRWE